MRTTVIALLTAVAGALLSLWGGDVATRAHNVTNMEGARGMLLVFAIAPAGFIAGLLIGIVSARSIGGEGFGGFARAQGVALGVTLALAAVVFGIALWKAPRAPDLDAIEFEVRMPPGRGAPDSTFGVLVTSRRSDDRHMATLRLDSLLESEGRVVIPAHARLRTRARGRSLVVHDTDDAWYWFDLPLPSNPGPEHEQWTDWWPAPGETATNDVRGNGGFQMRYRLYRTAGG